MQLQELTQHELLLLNTDMCGVQVSGCASMQLGTCRKLLGLALELLLQLARLPV